MNLEGVFPPIPTPFNNDAVDHRSLAANVARWGPSPTCAGDINAGCGDGQVNIDDLLALIGLWGPCIGCPADIDQDGVVTALDLSSLIDGWGACP